DVARCWYVGDTLDREGVAGRRAGVGAMLVTRTRHTDNPPFVVSAAPDYVFDTPEGVFDLLQQAKYRPESGAVVELPRADTAAIMTKNRDSRPVVFIDHGGVIAEADRTHVVLSEAAEELMTIAARAG